MDVENLLQKLPQKVWEKLAQNGAVMAAWRF
jgi:hypothetical protein